MKTQKYKYVGKKPLKWRGKEYDGDTPTKEIEKMLKEFPFGRLFYKEIKKGGEK